MSINHKLGLGFGSLVGLVLLLTMLAWQNMKISENLDVEQHRLEQFQKALLESRRHEKNILLRNDVISVQQHRHWLAILTSLIDEEKNSVRVSEVAIWQEVEQDIQVYRRSIEPIFRNQGLSLTERIAMGESITVPLARHMHEAIQKLEKIRNSNRQFHLDWTERFYAGYIVFTILLSILIVFFIAYSLHNSLQTGIRFVREIESGNLRATIPKIPSDEIGMLLNAMQKMGSELQRLEEANIHAMAARLALSALLETSQEPLPLPRLLEVALQIVLTVPFLKVERKGAIFLVDEKTRSLRMVASQGLDQDVMQSCQEVAPGVCMCGRALNEGKLLFSSYMDERHDIRHPGMSEHGHYCLPILSRGSVQAVMTLYLAAGHQQASEDEALLANVAFTLSGILERKRLEERMRHMAHHDMLTSLPNRVLFNEHLSLALAKAARNQRILALMLIDLDHFKNVNDTLGHAAGDHVLIVTTRRIRACLRASDLVARLGGDEFAVILSDLIDREGVARVADKIVQSVCQPITWQGDRATVGASIGIALFPDHGMEENELMVCADKAMYKVKERGRNGYNFYEIPVSS
ncbi:MAG: GGDEF domain-containing protein [Magnetococcales bacterium]|nr:GGDEF domain-containing protein [Magnetococcales bacterium]